MGMTDPTPAQSDRHLRRYLPAWLAQYRRGLLPQDALAGVIVAIMLVPQSMAYAMLAGLPPQYGMYASMLPLVAYALFGTSMTLAVGPVAVMSLMTATALTPLLAPGSAEYIAGAALLALLSGALLFALGLLRLGFIARLLSNPVISGFTSGSALLILISQLQPLLGIQAGGGTAVATALSLAGHVATLQPATAAIGVGALAILALAREYPARLARAFGMADGAATLLPKLLPMLVVIAAIALDSALNLHAAHGVPVVGRIPAGLPALVLPRLSGEHLRALLFPACTIALINFVSSIAVAQTLALQRKQRISADAELRGLGAANIASAICGGFPVSGAFARSLVNFRAGAQTPLAGVVSALLMAVIVLACTGLFTQLPVAVLAAIIIATVAPLIDINALRRTWAYDRADAVALAGTAAGVVLLGVEAGIAIGVGLSLASLVWRSGHPHIAVLGRVPHTEHFRNVRRYETETLPQLVALRIAEYLSFAISAAVELRVREEVELRPGLAHVLLVLSSVSQIDATAMEMLVELNTYLAGRGIKLHLAEVKGPVLDRLQNSPLPAQLSGRIFLSTHQAFLEFADAMGDYSPQ
jgi:SulP family sulfate permease